MHILVLVDCLICNMASGSYMSISSQSMLNCSSTLAMRMQASGLKLKFRSRLMSTSGPTASRKVPIKFSMWRRTGVEIVPSVVPPPRAKPPPYTVAGSPGMTMLVFRAVNPFCTTSRPRSATSSKVRRGGTPISSWALAREVPQWDQ